MKERPILFSAPMVRAILEGRKVVTRRVVKLTTPKARNMQDWSVDGIRVGTCPYGQPGERLWVRETWGQLYPLLCDDEPVFWRADYSELELREQLLPKWRPSIHMYRWASRITLEVTGVRVERLQDITSADIVAEGVQIPTDAASGNVLLDMSTRYGPSHFLTKDTMTIRGALLRAHWAALWVSINGIESWNANPWVWAIEFKRVEAQAA